MILFAFSKNTWQYFVLHGKKQKISKAIKSDVEYARYGSSGSRYTWDSTVYKFKSLPEEN